jgi:dTDP-glucose 4,6-dehydratase
LGTQVIINSCVKNKVDKLIYISTDEVYGQLTDESAESWKEDAPLNPRNPYSATKAAGELLVKAASESFGLKYNITRSSNNYGPRQFPEKLLPKTIKCILENKPIPIYGQGLQIRDWTHVYDNCSALFAILNSGKDNETYNISANQEFTNLEVIQSVCNAMGKGHDLISFVEDPRKSHDFRYSVNTSKLRALGWKPTTKFKDGIVDTVNWYLNNQYFLKY